MKNFILFLFCILLFSCKENQIDTIVVKEKQSHELNLGEGIGYIGKRADKKEEFKFHVSQKDLSKIENIYFKNELYKLSNEELIYSTNTKNIIMPSGTTFITIKFKNGKSKEIKFYDDGRPEPFERMPNPKISEFFKETMKIVKNIRDSVKIKSDIIYL